MRRITLSQLATICVVSSAVLVSSVLIFNCFQHNTFSHPMIYQYVLPLFFAVMSAGIGLFSWQVISLFKKMRQAEYQLLKINSVLQESENRFRSAFDHAAIGMALISLQGKYVRVNQAICQILGYSEEELLKIDHSQIIHSDDVAIHNNYFQEMLKGKIKHYQLVQRYFKKSGEVIWIAVHTSLITNDAKQPLYFIAQLQNITSEKNAEEQLRHLAYHDALTGLYNRNKLEQHLQDVLMSATRHETGFAVIFLDLDRFKYINDTIGHDAGDVLLQVVAHRLKKCLRNTDLTARVGGDEFIIVLTDINQVDLVVGIVQKILTSLTQPILIKSSEVYVTTSMGISVYPYDGNDTHTLMKNADLALYRAKELGRNNYQFCTPEMTAKAQQKMSRQNALVNALAKNEFELFYQPKLDLAQQKINGLEALLRWHNSEFKYINANEIIQLAEESGLIIALNDWVLQTACEQLKELHAAGHMLSMSVNLSVRQFKQNSFVENLLKILNQVNLSPEYLELEITESLIMQDPEYIMQTLHELKKHKIKIAIDDFGTGYSSLNYMRRFAIDKIKIDRTFIQRLMTDATCCSVVTAIIAMANKLGIKTIAEGVETKEQYEFLAREKCSEIQGYYLCPPDNFKTISQFLLNPLVNIREKNLSEKK